MSVGRAGPFLEAQALLQRRRLLPAAGEVLLEIGDRVEHDTVVARAAGRGLLQTVNAAKILDVLPAEVPGSLVRPVGAAVVAGEPLARTRGIWGMFRSICRAPVSGTVVAVSGHTGRILLEEPGAALEIQAFLPGVVTEIVPERGVTVAGVAARVAGVFGVGGERHGLLRAAVGRPEAVLDAAQLDHDVAGQVLIGGALVTADALQRAAALNVAGLITGGIHDRDLTRFLGRESVLADTAGVAAPLTLVITGGFGRVPMAAETFALLQKHIGRRACLVGRTRVRAGAERPEVIIPLAGAAATGPASRAVTGLAVGCRVLIVRQPWFAQEGYVGRLPDEPRRIESGAYCLVAEVDLPAGGTVQVPRANLEILAGPRSEATS